MRQNRDKNNNIINTQARQQLILESIGSKAKVVDYKIHEIKKKKKDCKIQNSPRSSWMIRYKIIVYAKT